MKPVRHGIMRRVRGITLLAAVFLLPSSLAVAHGGGHGGHGGHWGGNHSGHNTYVYGGWGWWDYPSSYGGFTNPNPFGGFPGFGGFGGFDGPIMDKDGYWIANGAQYLWIPYGW
jgi:hypothetical protein